AAVPGAVVAAAAGRTAAIAPPPAPAVPVPVAVVAAAAAGQPHLDAAHGAPLAPVDPGGVAVGVSRDVHVGGERNDRHLDGAAGLLDVLELGEQLMRGSLERLNLARIVHRSGVVEDERDAQPSDAPGDR